MTLNLKVVSLLGGENNYGKLTWPPLQFSGGNYGHVRGALEELGCCSLAMELLLLLGRKVQTNRYLSAIIVIVAFNRSGRRLLLLLPFSGPKAACDAITGSEST